MVPHALPWHEFLLYLVLYRIVKKDTKEIRTHTFSILTPYLIISATASSACCCRRIAVADVARVSSSALEFDELYVVLDELTLSALEFVQLTRSSHV